MGTRGVVAVWSGSAPLVRAFPLADGELVLGRELLADGHDDLMSREHAWIRQSGDRYLVEDMQSRYGTWVSGQQAAGELAIDSRWVVRTGHTVWVVFDDIRPFQQTEVSVRDGVVRGARTAQLIDDLEKAAVLDRHVVLAGEPGTGRGHLARAYARWRGRAETLVTVDDVPGLQQGQARELLQGLESTPELRVVLALNTVAAPIYAPLEAFLRRDATWLDVPSLRDRPDELARIAHEIVIGVNPALTCHASLIEQCLIGVRQLGLLASQLAAAAHHAVSARAPVVRTFDGALSAAWAVFPRGPRTR